MTESSRILLGFIKTTSKESRLASTCGADEQVARLELDDAGERRQLGCLLVGAMLYEAPQDGD